MVDNSVKYKNYAIISHYGVRDGANNIIIPGEDGGTMTIGEIV